MNDFFEVVWAMRWPILIVALMVIAALAWERYRYGSSDESELNEPEPVPWPEYMYVNFPDGTVRRCKTIVDPTYGFPVTPGLDSPEWEIVDN